MHIATPSNEHTLIIVDNPEALPIFSKDSVLQRSKQTQTSRELKLVMTTCDAKADELTNMTIKNGG